MLDHLPWIIGGLAVGFFVGYALGRYKGASEASGAPGPEAAPAEGGSGEEGEPPGTDSEEVVYIRRGSGSHYHRPGCRHLRGRGFRMAKGAALKKGYRRCPSCRP
jgi:hypothetical protein